MVNSSYISKDNSCANDGSIDNNKKADLKSLDQPRRNVNVNDDQMIVICINNGCDIREMGEGVTGY